MTFSHAQEPVRPMTDAWMAAHDLDRVGGEVSKLSRLLEILDDIAIGGAPCLDASPERWESYVERIGAVVAAMQAFSCEIEHLTADYAAKLRATPPTGRCGPGEHRHAA